MKVHGVFSFPRYQQMPRFCLKGICGFTFFCCKYKLGGGECKARNKLQPEHCWVLRQRATCPLAYFWPWIRVSLLKLGWSCQRPVRQQFLGWHIPLNHGVTKLPEAEFKDTTSPAHSFCNVKHQGVLVATWVTKLPDADFKDTTTPAHSFCNVKLQGVLVATWSILASNPATLEKGKRIMFTWRIAKTLQSTYDSIIFNVAYTQFCKWTDQSRYHWDFGFPYLYIPRSCVLRGFRKE